MKRRTFLRGAAAGFSIPYWVPSGVLARPGRLGANDRIQVGFVGCGGRARQLMTTEKLSDQADLVALADCYRPRCDERARELPDGDKVRKYGQYRELFEKEKLDAVFVPTTTHARALICIHAMQAGLDVYAEKPLTLTIAEGQVLRLAVKRYQRVLQVGTQQRSIPINAWASRRIREGAIGKVREVLACNFLPPETWKPRPEQPRPDGLDWDQWCNQTELRPYHKDLQFGWSRWRDYDGGGVSWGVSGWGTHALDQVQCALGTDDTGPVELWPDGADEQGIVKVTLRYENGTLLKCHGPRRKPQLDDLGAIFIGEKGRVEIVRGDYRCDPPDLLTGGPPRQDSNIPGEVVEHIRDFFEAMRTRKPPRADVETAHRSNTICHLINICRDLNRRLRWDPRAERFIGDDEADGLRSRPRRKGFELPAFPTG
ncbi:MAG: Gfo/Idh/MocA family oxidoreductase [Phycisphaerae bacterium]|jgi:predicted dehydrogenase